MAAALVTDGLWDLDFDPAKLVQPAREAPETESLTETRAVAGTLPCMAPEQLWGEAVDARSDILAAGRQ